MKKLTAGDWTKITTQKMAIRMAPKADDLDGHAYGLYEQPPPDPKNIMASLQVPANWYDRLFNTMVHICGYAKGKDQEAIPWFLLLIKNTARCDSHWFPVRPPLPCRGDKQSMPRVNLKLANAKPAVVSYYLMEDLINLKINEKMVETWCDLVITRIHSAP